MLSKELCKRCRKKYRYNSISNIRPWNKHWFRSDCTVDDDRWKEGIVFCPEEVIDKNKYEGQIHSIYEPVHNGCPFYFEQMVLNQNVE